MLQARDKLLVLALRKALLPSRTGEVLPISTKPQVLLPTALTGSDASSQAALPVLVAVLLHSLLNTVQQVQSTFIAAVVQLAERGVEGCSMEDTMCAGLNALTLVEA